MKYGIDIYNHHFIVEKLDESKEYDYIYDDEEDRDIMFFIGESTTNDMLFVFASDLAKYDKSIPIYRDTFKKDMVGTMSNKYNMNIEIASVIFGNRLIPGQEYIAYKGTDKFNKCINKSYELDVKYKEDDCSICRKGIHACLCPLNCFAYYPPADFSKYFIGHGILKDTFCGTDINDDTKCVFSEFTLDDELTLDYLIGKSIKYIKDNYKNNIIDANDRNAAYPDILHSEKDYSYIKSRFIGISRGKLSIIESSSRIYRYYNMSISYGDSSIAKSMNPYATAISHGVNSISCTDDEFSTSISYRMGSKSICNGEKSVAIGHDDNIAETNETKSIAILFGHEYEGSAITTDEQSIAVGVECYEAICKAPYSVAVGNNIKNVVKTEKEASVAVSYSSDVEVGPNSVAVIMIKYNDADYVSFSGGINSRIIINVLHEDTILKTTMFIIDGEKIQQDKKYEYYPKSDVLRLNEEAVSDDSNDI